MRFTIFTAFPDVELVRLKRACDQSCREFAAGHALRAVRWLQPYASRNREAGDDQYQENRDEDEEQQLGNREGCAGNLGETQNPCRDTDNQKEECPTKHGAQPGFL